VADRPRLILVLGGARSGKSTFAEKLADERSAGRPADGGATALTATRADDQAAARAASPSPDTVSPSPHGTHADVASPARTAASAATVDSGSDAAGIADAVVDAAGAVLPPSGTGRVASPARSDGVTAPASGDRVTSPASRGRVTYLATSQALDDEMRARVARHQSERPATWTTVESPLEIPNAVREHAGHTDVFLLDCITFWVTNLLFATGGVGDQEPEGLGDFNKEFIAPEVESAAAARVRDAVDDLLAALSETGATLIAVSNEVGLGLVPEYPLGRLYRDELGRANHRLAAAADEAYFLVAGLPLDLKALAVTSRAAQSSPTLSSSLSSWPPSPPSASPPLSSPSEEEPTP